MTAPTREGNLRTTDSGDRDSSIRALAGESVLSKPSRPIGAGELETFVRQTIEMAVAAGHHLPSGAVITEMTATASGNVRAHLSDDSTFYVEIEHMVPRDYFSSFKSGAAS